MFKHKSFVLNCGKKPEAKMKPMAISYASVMEPEIAKNTTHDTISHYDDNEEISLVLPQSLSLTDENPTSDVDENDSENGYEPYNSRSQAYPSNEDEEDDYSDANAYFNESQSFSGKNNSDLENETIETESKKINPAQTNDDKPTESHEAVVVHPDDNDDDNDDDDDSTLIEQDKKFEEDIKSILKGKKQFDKERIQSNPDDAIKGKNHGLMEKNEKKIEDKLKNDHAIFDKIAQSMAMASSYDLGSIAMDKKFDILEKETDKDFNKKIHDLIEKDKQENPQTEANQVIEEVLDSKKKEILEQAEIIEIDAMKKAVEDIEEGDEKVETKDFLNDLDRLKDLELDSKTKTKNKLSKQSSFNSTISIKEGSLKSRIFEVIGTNVEVMINSKWNPSNSSELNEFNVTLTKSVDYWADADQGTRKFRIGGPDTKTWNDLEPGNYYLTFFFVNQANPSCELQGTLEVKA